MDSTPPSSINPSPATPQTSPTLWGLGQSIITGLITAKASAYFGAPPDVAASIGAGVASSLTSGLHAWAQKIHLSPAS